MSDCEILIFIGLIVTLGVIAFVAQATAKGMEAIMAILLSHGERLKELEEKETK